MDIPNLILPVFGVIVTGWLAGATGYLPRPLSGQIVQFAYNVAMPALVFLTIARAPLGAMLDSGFLAAFGGGSALCFMAVFATACLYGGRTPAAAGMQAAAATMTNTGFVALPVLQALYGPAGVLPAAIATVFIAIAMFPPLIILLEAEGFRRAGPLRLVNVVLINPVMLSTLLGLAWSAFHLPLPSAVAAYLSIFADALTPCALFAIGLGLSLADSRGLFRITIVLTAIKLLALPLVVLCIADLWGLGHVSTVAAVICAAVPTAKTAYMLAGEYRVEDRMVASTVSVTTFGSILTLLGWLYLLG